MVRMRVQMACVMLVAGMLAGCGVHDEARPAAFASGNGQLSWQGTRACTDCDGIESQLVLSWSGNDRRYQLADIYFSAGEALRFDVDGVWRNEGDRILLDGGDGTWRAYRLLDDGRLQPQDAPGGEDVLMPSGAIDVE